MDGVTKSNFITSKPFFAHTPKRGETRGKSEKIYEEKLSRAAGKFSSGTWTHHRIFHKKQSPRKNKKLDFDAEIA